MKILVNILVCLCFTVSKSQSVGDCTLNGNLVLNPSFETPVIGWNWSHVIAPNWINLNNNGFVELHRNFYLQPVQGNQFLELNAASLGKVYQELTIDTGRPVYWSFCYSRRAPNLGERIILKISDNNDNNMWQNNYELTSTRVWNYIEGIYYPTYNQTNIKFLFDSFSLDQFQGNLIDNVQITYLDCISPAPDLPNQVFLCENSNLNLSIQNVLPQDQILWNTGSIQSQIIVDNQGTYSVIITRPRGGCAPPLVFSRSVNVVLQQLPITSPISTN